LIDLGFTVEQVTGGHIKATDVMFKLAEAYDKNKNSNNLAKQTTEVFGRAGQELTRILKGGNVELQERIRLMQVYNEQAVRGGAATARFIEKGEKRLKYHFGGKQAELLGFEIMSSKLEDVEKQTRKEMGINGGVGVQEMRESGQFPEFYQKYLKNAARAGLKPEDVLSVIEQQASDAGFLTSEKAKSELAVLSGFLRSTVEDEERARNKNTLSDTGDLVDLTAGGAKEPLALLSSSLQAIGGGDISSVMSGLGANEVAENTKRTADGVQKLVEKNVDQTPVSDVAK